MAYKSILTALLGAERDGEVLDAAMQLATAQGAHLDVLCIGVDRTLPDPIAAGAVTMSQQVSTENAEQDAERAEKLARTRLDAHSRPWNIECLTTVAAGLPRLLTHRIQYADLVVLARPYGPTDRWESEALAEAALFNGPAPVLFVSEGKLPDFAARPVVVGWNEAPQALAAIRAALPFLAAAPSVRIAMIAPSAQSPDRSDPGGALAEMLTRHGVRVEIDILEKARPTFGGTLLDHASAKGAGLLVMGAYGHSRLRESVFGGSTRTALESATLPLLMSR